MCGEHTQHTGRTCATSDLPAGGVCVDVCSLDVRAAYDNRVVNPAALAGFITSVWFVSFSKVRALADRYGLSVHMDGARVMNAAVALGVPPSTILQHTHTVSVCLSKVGLQNTRTGWAKTYNSVRTNKEFVDKQKLL